MTLVPKKKLIKRPLKYLHVSKAFTFGTDPKSGQRIPIFAKGETYRKASA